MPPVEARPGWSYDERMKACLFSAALIGSAVAVSVCLAAERSAAPAHATAGQTAAHPTDPARGHQPSSPGGTVQSPPAASGERSGVDVQDKSVSKALRPDAEPPPAGPIHAHGSPQPTGQSHDDSARPSSPIDTRITVNQGRTLETHKNGRVPTQGGPLDNASRANARQGGRVPHAVVRSGTLHGPTRNAIGVAPDINVGAPRIGGTAFPSTGGAKSPAAARSTILPGVRPLPSAPAMGRIGSSAPSMGSPVVQRPAAINGTGMARGPLRPGEIGGPAKNNGGINGSSVRAKRP